MLGNLFSTTVLGFALVWGSISNCDSVRVDVDKGSLRGFNSTTPKGTQFFAFKGIPYAKPPVGNLRFKAPVEETPWDGVRDATAHGAVCPQDLSGEVIGNESCLFLNVYTPSLRNRRLPVMVWIHGGSLFEGSGNAGEYGPDFLIDAGVIYVTMNYRLGALGFLSTQDNEAPGNFGLKDQVAALKWVKRNIAKFGGDPDNVTIFGESSGASSVEYHLLSPLSSGLFVRAITESGSTMNTWALSEDPVGRAIRLAEALRNENLSGNKSKALEILKTASFRDIVTKQGRSLWTESEVNTMTLLLFGAAVEKHVRRGEVFLPDTPQNILESGNFRKVPRMVGYNNREGIVFLADTSLPKGEFGALNDTEGYVPSTIKDKNLRNEIARSIRTFYFKDRPIGNENISNLIDLYTDSQFASGIRRATELQLRCGQAPVYFYEFSYDGGLNFIKKLFNISIPGAAHGDELGYLFHPTLLTLVNTTVGPEDEHVINTMTRLWTNFAKYGNPTPAGDPLTWKPATLERFNFLNISGFDTKLDVNPDPERAQFWKNAYERDAAIRHGR